MATDDEVRTVQHRQRMVWLDAAKGLSMLMVMLVHANALPRPDIFFSGCVALFFVASGYTCRDFALSSDNIKKKAKRLLIPYFVYAVIFTVFAVAVLAATGKDFNLLQRLTAVLYARRYMSEATQNYLLLTGGCAPLWFMPAMFCAYIYAFVGVWLYHKFKHASYLIISFSAFILLLLPKQDGILLPWSMDVAVAGTILIGIGHYLKKAISVPYQWILFILSVIVYAVVNWLNGEVNMSISQYGDWGSNSFVPFLIVGTTAAIIAAGIGKVCEHTFIGTALAYIGRHSLRLMCIHMFFIVTLKEALGSHMSFWIYTTLAFILIFTTDWICQVIVNKLGERVVLLQYV